MKVLIKDVTRTGAELQVVFECACGYGSGLWSGAPPLPGNQRFVELGIEQSVTVENYLKTTDAPLGLRIEDGGQALVGVVTKLGEDGCARLDLGCGGVDLSILGPLPELDRRYRLLVRELRIFDCNY